MSPCVLCTVKAKAFWIGNCLHDAVIPLMLKYDMNIDFGYVICHWKVTSMFSLFVIFVIIPMLPLQ